MNIFEQSFKNLDLTSEAFEAWVRFAEINQTPQYAELALLGVCNHRQGQAAMIKRILPKIDQAQMIEKAVNWAVEHRHVEIVDLLLKEKERFPEINFIISLQLSILKKQEDVALKIIPFCSLTDQLEDLLIQSVQSKQLRLINHLLTIASEQEKQKAFRWAVLSNDRPLMELFIQKIDPKEDQSIALYVAARYQKFDAFYFLLDHCSLEDAWVHTKNDIKIENFFKQVVSAYHKDQLAVSSASPPSLSKRRFSRL